MGSKVAVIVPARGGSKRLPRKNLITLGGIPLFQIACIQGLHFGDVYVSTEDNEIKEAALKAGYAVIDRPLSLAQDDSTGISVVQHAVRGLTQYEQFVLLQPTTPFRMCKTVAEEIEDAAANGYTSGLTLVDDGRFVWTRGEGPVNRRYFTRPRSQDKEPTTIEDGAIYWFGRDVLDRQDYHCDRPAYFSGVLAPDIDSPEELETARMLWSNQWLTL